MATEEPKPPMGPPYLARGHLRPSSIKNLLKVTLAFVLALLTLKYTLASFPSGWITSSSLLQKHGIVSWDKHSLIIRGERVLILSGEVHPFRIPVPGLWLDIFQKVKALGFNCVSFYVDWALLEGKPGNFSANGIFDLKPFFAAAQAAGIYLLARPGPYINAEVSGGGFPGWLQRVPGTPRTSDKEYLRATDLYVKSVARLIAEAQIQNGGPVILLQPENEYTWGDAAMGFPDGAYMDYVMHQYREAGIEVPLISNDAAPRGLNAPGTPGAVDIYGHDAYPLGFDCANPRTWPDESFPTDFAHLHKVQSPKTPYSVIEFQGGSFDPWGGWGFDQCTALLNCEFERVFYKNLYAFGVKILNLYMIFGGTNWGNLGHPGGYTSYDYGSVITEERLVSREKYSEVKLQANFLMASPAYLAASPGKDGKTTGAYVTNDDLFINPLFGNRTSFYIIRHSNYSSFTSLKYKLVAPTSLGSFSIPQLGGELSLKGRDSKIHVTDYDCGDINLVYSSAELFTWQKYPSKTVIIFYGDIGEQHELALGIGGNAEIIEGPKVTIDEGANMTIINWEISASRTILKMNDNVIIYLLDRNSAYDYWVLQLDQRPNSEISQSVNKQHSVIVKAGYLLRKAESDGSSLHLTGDINATTTIEIVGGAPEPLSKLTFNGENLEMVQDPVGATRATVAYVTPKYEIPDLNTLNWKYIDSMPELRSDYSDSEWTVASHKTSNNTARKVTTPTSLYSSDYGYHTGYLIYRGHFTASGSESTIELETQGGLAYGMSTWIDGIFVGSWRGFDGNESTTTTFDLPNLTAGTRCILTVLIDNLGLDENWFIGPSVMHNPRGILDYTLAGHDEADVTWKLTGNLGGEDYRDQSRGPLNEGGLWAERQGYHLPGAPISSWKDSKGPVGGIDTAGVGFFAATFTLDMPRGYDIPLSFLFRNTTRAEDDPAPAYRVQLYVNGYQFGKMIGNIGPQTKFPVPEGILDYHGSNYVAVSLWALDEAGAKVEGLNLVAGFPVQSGYGEVEMSPVEKWEERVGAH